MKKTAFLFLIAAGLQMSAQEKLLTMEEAVVKQRTTLAPSTLTQLMWVKNADSYSYVNPGEVQELFICNASDGKVSLAIGLNLINEELKKIDIGTFKAFPVMKWKSENEFTFGVMKDGKRYFLAFDIKTKKLSKEATIEIEAEHSDVAEKSRYVAYTIKNNLFVNDGKNTLIVTNDKDENIVNGQSVHRDEFGISKGTYWSPNGGLLAFYRMDQTMVTDYPVIDWTSRPAKNENIKYPMAGDKSHEVTVGIYNVSNGKTIFIKTGEPKEQYLTNVAWSKDEQHLYIAVLNRAQNEMKLNSYSTVTGLFEKTLFEEKHEKYVHPMRPLVFLPNASGQFIWQSERDGFNHLYLYNADGTLVKQLTKGSWIVTDLQGFDPKGTKAFYSSTTESGITRNFYSVEIKTGKITRITSGDGTHASMLSSKGTYIIDNFQSTVVPRNINIVSTNGKKSRTIHTAKNPLAEFKLGEMSIFKLKSESGEDLYCRLFKPVAFDSTKKYPVIVYLYNGPGLQMINNTWNGGGDLWFQYMAERGYVVFTMDGRGSANRGLAFEQAIHKQVGVNEMKDQMVGVDFLKSQKYVDGNRMGIFGWSYGGFMTSSIMLRYPDVFKAGIAGGPVIDWSYYEVMYTERYMSTPQLNPEGYNESRVINHVDKLKGKLLVIHGAQDNVVVWQHSIQFLKACIEKNKQVDYFIYPGHEHNVLGKEREHLYQKATDYFMQNL